MSLWPEAEFRPVGNYTPGAMRRPRMGIVLHHTVGPLDAAEARFNQRGSSASAHFGNPMGTGRMRQWVDTDDVAWAQVDGNWTGWVSVENESWAIDDPATPDDELFTPLTVPQLERVAALLAWDAAIGGYPIQVSDDPGTPGLAYHSMNPPSWGLTACPGQPIIDQRPEICARALGTWVSASPKEDDMADKPAVAVTPDGTVHVFVRGTDNQLWWKYQKPGQGWTPDQTNYAALGGVLTSAPAAAARPDGSVVVVVRGGDAAAWCRELPAGKSEWSPWAGLGGQIAA
jgi:hypothetical protein